MEVDKAEMDQFVDAAMWVVKNFEEWTDTPAWAGAPFEALAESIDKLREVLPLLAKEARK